MKKSFLIKTIFGQHHVIVDQKWKRMLVLGPWILLLLITSISLELASNSEMAEKIGYSTFFISIAFAFFVAFLLYAIIFSHALFTRMDKHLFSTSEINKSKAISFRVFEFFVLIVFLMATLFINHFHYLFGFK